MQVTSSFARHRYLLSRREHNHKMMMDEGNDDNSDSDWDPGSRSSKRQHITKKRPQQQFGSPAPKRQNLESAKITSRTFLTNERKHSLIQQFDELRPHFQTDGGALDKLHQHVPSVPTATMRGILSRRDVVTRSVLGGNRLLKSARRMPSRVDQKTFGQFPAEERILFDMFLEKRLKAEQVPVLWFAATMLRLVQESKPAEWEDFKGSDGWRKRMFKRYNIVLRVASNTKTETVEERVPKVVKFFTYFEAACRAQPHVCATYGKYPLSRRWHADEVPVEFGGSLTRTASLRGAKRVSIKHPRVRMEERVASVMMLFNAEGLRPRPTICLALTPDTDDNKDVDPCSPVQQRGRDEINSLRQDYPNVDILVQRNAYFDTVTCDAWARYFSDYISNQRHILVMDNLGGHSTPYFRQIMEDAQVELVSTPTRCTDLCAVTDCGLGRSVKLLMKKSYVQHFNDNTALWCSGKVTASMRRRLYVSWLSSAWQQFHDSECGRAQIVRAFERCGMRCRCDGTDKERLIVIEGFMDKIPFM